MARAQISFAWTILVLMLICIIAYLFAELSDSTEFMHSIKNIEMGFSGFCPFLQGIAGWKCQALSWYCGTRTPSCLGRLPDEVRPSPRNPAAIKNLGAILGREGDSLNPQDPQTVHGLAFAAWPEISSWPRSISRRCWICRYRRLWIGWKCHAD